jgi:hypothetical protein
MISLFLNVSVPFTTTGEVQMMTEMMESDKEGDREVQEQEDEEKEGSKAALGPEFSPLECPRNHTRGPGNHWRMYGGGSK